jgi:uncharacterized membrane protein
MLRTSQNSVSTKFAECPKGEVRRITIPRTPVNNPGICFVSSRSHHPHYTMSSAASGKEKKAEMTDSKPTGDRDEKELVEEWRVGKRLWVRRLLTTLLSVASILTPIVILIVLVMTIALTAYGAYTREWEWTGFVGKTLWDWMKLLLVPIILALGGLLFTQMDRLNSTRAQRLDRERLQVDRAQAQNALELNRRGQITDRFTRAIDQLGKVDDYGNKQVEIRVGGIYALEQIARDSEEDYWPIMEVLAAYLRQNAPWIPEEDQQGEELSPAPDIRAITDVLRRRNSYFGRGEADPLDLSLTNLSGANFLGANFSRTNLSRTNLSRAELQGAELQYANLQGADLREADLREADLRGAWLQGADFQGANLQYANLQGADFQGANLQYANLQGADLSSVQSLTQEQLEEAVGNYDTTLPEYLSVPVAWD